MEITATLNEIASLNLEDRIQLVQMIWDGIAAEQAYPELTEAQKQELDNRINDHEINPDNTMTWEEIKASIKKQAWITHSYFAQKFVTSLRKIVGYCDHVWKPRSLWPD
jgi:putative addiction module component (TIGR02574 family)